MSDGNSQTSDAAVPRFDRGMTAPVPVSSSRRPFLICASLFLLTFVVFFSAVLNDFLYWYGDDPLYVLENKNVNTGVSAENLWWALTSTKNSNWHPVTWLSHMLDVEMFGLKAWGHHLTSVILHAFNTALVFLCLRRLTGAAWRSVAVALLFAVHPLRVESVAWVSERKDVLSFFFWMTTLLLYARYVEEVRTVGLRRKLFYGLALVSLAFGLMSKGMLVTLPFVLLLLDFWPFKRFSGNGEIEAGQGINWKACRHLLLEKTPFFLLVLITCALTFKTQKSWGFVQTLEAYPLDVRVENAIVSYLRYIGKMLWPADLCNYYPHPGHWPRWLVLLAGAVVVGVSIFALRMHRRWPHILVGWFWYLGTLIPVIGLIQVGGQSIADRYTYIPMIGILVILVWSMHAWAVTQRIPPNARAAMLVIVAIPLILLTHRQIAFYKDSATLWRHAVAVTGKHGLAQYALGLGLSEQGQIDEGIRELKEVLAVKPDWVDVHANLGAMLFRQGQLEEALKHSKEALRLEPNRPKIHMRAGMIHRMQGQPGLAIDHFFRTLELDPENVAAYYYLGLTLMEQNRHLEAVGAFREVIKRKADDPQAQYYLGSALGQMGQTADAMRHLNEALKLEPDYPEAHNELGIAFGKTGNLDAAIEHLELALRQNPEFAEAHNNLGFAVLQKGRTNDAARHFQDALKINPTFAPARRNLKSIQGSAAPK